MENFLVIKKDDIIIEIVNLVKATRDQAEEFKTILLNHIGEGRQKIIVDLNQCIFIDSTFLAVLIIALKAVMKNGGTLKLTSPQKDVAAVLEATGMRRVFKVYNTTSEAINSFK
jgi:anti-anti-sigma factor